MNRVLGLRPSLVSTYRGSKVVIINQESNKTPLFLFFFFLFQCNPPAQCNNRQSGALRPESVGSRESSILEPRELPGWTSSCFTIFRILSMTEKARLVRALYRFQLHCNLFGVGHYFSRKVRLTLDFDAEDILIMFFGIYEPWEVEKIACIYKFV